MIRPLSYYVARVLCWVHVITRTPDRLLANQLHLTILMGDDEKWFLVKCTCGRVFYDELGTES